MSNEEEQHEKWCFDFEAREMLAPATKYPDGTSVYWCHHAKFVVGEWDNAARVGSNLRRAQAKRRNEREVRQARKLTLQTPSPIGL